MDYAYFIAPSGTIIPTKGKHIDTIILHPEKFGISKDYIKNIYDEFNEPMGAEGKARGYILTELLHRGFIRVRYTPTNDLFTFQVKSLSSKKTKDNIFGFIAHIFESSIKIGSPQSDAVILDVHPNVLVKGTLKKVAQSLFPAISASTAAKVLPAIVPIDAFNEKVGNILDLERYKTGNYYEKVLAYENIEGTSFSRIWRHFNNPEKCVGVISGFETDVDADVANDEEALKRNVRNTQEIAAALSSAKFGYVIVDGYWKNPSGEQVKEGSVLVTGNKETEKKLKELLNKLRIKYKQTAFAWKPCGTDDVFIVGSTEQKAGKFRPDKIGEMYSKIRNSNHTFVFASYWKHQSITHHYVVKADLDAAGLEPPYKIINLAEK